MHVRYLNKYKLSSLKNDNIFNKGMGLVEVVIASAIVMSSLVSIIGVYNSMAALSLRNTDSVQAALLAEEGVEIVRILRDKGWSNIASSTNGSTYSFYWNLASSTWVSTTTVIESDIFERRVVYSPVYRDVNFDISKATTGPVTLDPNSKKATVTVSWPTDAGTSSKSLEAYVFNTFNN